MCGFASVEYSIFWLSFDYYVNDIDFDLGLYGQLGIGTNTKQTLPMFVEALKNEKIYLICCGSFETVSKYMFSSRKYPYLPHGSVFF